MTNIAYVCGTILNVEANKYASLYEFINPDKKEGKHSFENIRKIRGKQVCVTGDAGEETELADILEIKRRKLFVKLVPSFSFYNLTFQAELQAQKEEEIEAAKMDNPVGQERESVISSIEQAYLQKVPNAIEKRNFVKYVDFLVHNPMTEVMKNRKKVFFMLDPLDIGKPYKFKVKEKDAKEGQGFCKNFEEDGVQERLLKATLKVPGGETQVVQEDVDRVRSSVRKCPQSYRIQTVLRLRTENDADYSADGKVRIIALVGFSFPEVVDGNSERFIPISVVTDEVR